MSDEKDNKPQKSNKIEKASKAPKPNTLLKGKLINSKGCENMSKGNAKPSKPTPPRNNPPKPNPKIRGTVRKGRD